MLVKYENVHMLNNINNSISAQGDTKPTIFQTKKTHFYTNVLIDLITW